MQNLSKEYLEELYIKQNLTRKEIAEKLNIKERTVKAYLSKFNIKKPKELQCLTNKKLKATLGKHWWNNGIEEIYIEECPDGFIPGMLKSRVEKMRKNWKLSAEGLKTLQENGKNSKGRKHTEEAKTKISNHWKMVAHPFTGKKRKEETRIKISNTLKGTHHNPAPKREKLEALTKEQLYTYLNSDKSINFLKIYKELNILNNQDSWRQVLNCYDRLGIEYVRNTAISNFEKEIVFFIKSIYSGRIEENKKHFLDTLEVDIYIPEYKLAIECNGMYWHQTSFIKENEKYISTNGYKTPDYHLKKAKLALNKGIELIYIWEDQWLNQQSLIKAILKSRLKKIELINSIDIKDCKIQEISNKQYKNFCLQNHIQGYKPAEIKIGLFYNKALAQVISFNAIQSDKDEYDWISECRINDIFILNSTKELFSYFIKKYNPKLVFYYVDWNLFNSEEIKNCGFNFVEYTQPNKFYFNKAKRTRVSSKDKQYALCMQKVINKKWLCCYDAGYLKFVWKKSENS